MAQSTITLRILPSLARHHTAVYAYPCRMPTLILVRHGRSTANTSALLAGRTPGVSLDERGAAQAAALPGRLAGLPVCEVVTSPLQRCRETVQPLLEARPGLRSHTEERIEECDYGDWSGRKLAELKDEPLMEVVQTHPSAAAFPGGESMRAMQTRAAEAVREWNARVERDHGADAVYLMCSHGDIIKSLVAEALGLHLDLFQRISVEPCSVTAIRYTRLRPFLVRLGDTGDFASLAPPEEPSESDAPVGGGAGAP
ncbi:histidine phosphatase family protein [Streptomyces rameus]|uniref:Histidine phosphatase family protein n=2 Tax=Streptomyces TaxID=1883 RepID=A0ABP6N318_9ACTN